MDPQPSTEPLIFSHDGGVDDYLALILLCRMPRIRLLGVIVTQADCYIVPAVSASRKILDLAGCPTPVATSTARGVNAFPQVFRKSSFAVDSFPILNEKDEILSPLVVRETGQEFMARLLKDAHEPVRILETGPLTTIAEVLAAHPELRAKIKSIVWMGGALQVPGNIDPIIEGGHDGSAEWNVYWDPVSAKTVFGLGIPITMCPLDLTNKVPVTKDFMAGFAKQRKHPLSDLAGLCYSLVSHQLYYAWDLLTAAFIGSPSLFTQRDVRVDVVDSGVSQGKTFLVEAGGAAVTLLVDVDLGGFYNYIKETMR